MKMELIDNMNGNVTKYLNSLVLIEIENIERDNNNKFPDAISKTMHKKKINDIMCKVLENEKIISEMTVSDNRGEGVLCPYCSKALSDFVNYIMITEYMKRGCNYCF